MKRFSPLAAAALLLTTAVQCGGGSAPTGGTGAAGSATVSSGTAAAGGSGASTTSTGMASSSTGSTGTGGAAPVTAADLLALVQACNQLPGTTKFATDSGEPNTVSICQLTGAVFWKADLDIDCDGGQSRICKSDPSYLPDTSATDSQGKPLDASTLPFVVVPLPSNGFDSAAAGLKHGSVIAVIYDGKLEFGIFGDKGPKGIIGEASYAMAELLGIDPNPVSGGADSGAVYIAFTGAGAVVTTNEDHAEAAALGASLAAKLVSDN